MHVTIATMAGPDSAVRLKTPATAVAAAGTVLLLLLLLFGTFLVSMWVLRGVQLVECYGPDEPAASALPLRLGGMQSNRSFHLQENVSLLSSSLFSVAAAAADAAAAVPEDKKKKKRATWIYVLGDSSLRILNAALVDHFNRTLQDSHFGSFLVSDKGGCVAEDTGHTGLGCLREFISWDHMVRITYSFKTYASQKILVLDHLTSHSQQPDVFVLATGAWDFYGGRSVGDTLSDTLQWIRAMRKAYPASRLIFCNLVSCHPGFKHLALPFNAQLNGSATVPVLDRQWNTVNVTDHTLCEGWHAQGVLVKQHVHALLEMIFPGRR